MEFEISDELLERYHISKERCLQDPLTGYVTFLSQTAEVIDEIVEAQYLGITINEDYKEILDARQHAREQIRTLSNI